MDFITTLTEHDENRASTLLDQGLAFHMNYTASTQLTHSASLNSHIIFSMSHWSVNHEHHLIKFKHPLRPLVLLQ